ncbi:MAG: ETC complex I subunit [Roseomonas sp.]|nr:ETC complex I subunit [Roseomonas sp.]
MSETKGFARIYQKAKSAMQSGRAGKAGWVLSFVPSEAQRADHLVGWYGSADTSKQVVLHFETRERAIAYAEAQGLLYEAEAPAKAAESIKPKVYADNFKFDRHENWSH